MQSKRITTIIILALLLISLSAAGCTTPSPTLTSPSPTLTPTKKPNWTTLDLSRNLTASFESDTVSFKQPFAKSINSRGNDVYTGVTVTKANNGTIVIMSTVVVEFTNSEAAAKTVFDNEVATKKNAGFGYYAHGEDLRRAGPCKQCTDVWVGTLGNETFSCDTQFNNQFGDEAWLVTSMMIYT